MKQDTLQPGLRVGILGGGQLARMLVLAGHRLGLEMHVLSDNRHDPAGLVTAHHHASSVKDTHALEAFLKNVDVVTFESEFVDGKMLSEVSRKTGTPLKPDPLLMDSLQDRLDQKNLLVQHQIPTAEFLPVGDLNEFTAAQNHFKNNFVLKKRRFGYDGYGTFYSSARKPLVFTVDPHGYIAETKISFRRELATQLFRNAQGQVEIFPLVETFQENSRCLWVKGPVKHPKFKSFAAKLKKFVQKLGLEGTIAFELFDTGKDLLVNEIAPRVHNSGHYSMNGLRHCQFEMHLRSCLGLRLPSAALAAPGFAMWNLLGEGTERIRLSAPPDAHLHWYGKAKNPAGRKMGHLNATSVSPNEALNIVRKRRKDFCL